MENNLFSTYMITSNTNTPYSIHPMHTPYSYKMKAVSTIS